MSDRDAGDARANDRDARADRAGDARADRAAGALWGLAVGDALGMPTQLLSRERIAREFGPITGFVPGPPDHPVSAGLPAGHVTDDTDQALLVARLFAAGEVAPRSIAAALRDWETRMRAVGSLELLGPSTRRAIDAVNAGVPPEQAGRHGDTNGAAMRIAGVGIGCPPEPVETLVDRVVAVSRVTHDTGVAIAGAAAVAAAVSVGVEGDGLAAALAHGVSAARLGGGRGHYVAGADVASRIEWALSLVGSSESIALDRVYRLVGTSIATQESVPAAFALAALYDGDPWAVGCAAATLGGDSDTVAAMAGAIAGSVRGASALPAAAIAQLRAVNSPDLDDVDGLVAALLRLRDADRRGTVRGS